MKRELKLGRPVGSKTFEPDIARAFGAVIREIRTELGVSQEELGHKAQIERSHMGKIERGQHLPNSTAPGALVDQTTSTISKGD